MELVKTIEDMSDAGHVWHRFDCGAESFSRLPRRLGKPTRGLGWLDCPMCFPDNKNRTRGLVVLYVRLPEHWQWKRRALPVKREKGHRW